MYRKCKKRMAKNEFGENMCGAIACCEIGDMFCECPECRKECDKEYALECFSVHCIDSDGLEYDVGVMTYDENAAKRSAVYSLKEGRNVNARAISCKRTESI